MRFARRRKRLRVDRERPVELLFRHLLNGHVIGNTGVRK